MYNIRTATTEDIPLIRELSFRIWPQTYAGIISPEQIDYMLGMMYSESSLLKQMEDGAQFILVYDDQSVPVAFASYQAIGSTVYKLHKIYVLPDQQGKGTGRYIIDHICRIIKPGGATALQLQVNRNNKAKEFYERLGFAVIEMIKLDIGSGFVMDDYVMEKKI